MFSQLLKISYDNVLVKNRGFQVKEKRVKDKLEQIGETFLDGYHAVVEDPVNFTKKLEVFSLEFKGFAYEGAGMALKLLDLFYFNKGRFQDFTKHEGAAHSYMLHVGAGWSYAKLPMFPKRDFQKQHPIYKWLIVDGMGFYFGYFHWDKFKNGMKAPGKIKSGSYMENAFFQGVGRSLWFVFGANIEAVSAAINSFPTNLHNDLWSGVGLASAYAGGLKHASYSDIRKFAGDNLAAYMQGVAFANTARIEASTPAAHTAITSLAMCNMNPVQISNLTHFSLEEAKKLNNQTPIYQNWRAILQQHLAKGVPVKCSL